MSNDLKMMLIQTELDSFKTSHLLHLLLAMVTVGIWILPWVIISKVNSMKKTRYLKKLRSAGGI